MTQAVWSTAHGDVLSVTDVHGEQISRLGAHFDPILAATRAALVALARPRAAARRPGRRRRARSAARSIWLARKHLGAELGGRGARARVPALPARAVADAERLPPGRARVPAAPLRVVVPRRGAALGVRALRRGGDRDEGARRPRGRRDGRLVRRAPPAAAGRGPRSRVVAGAVALVAALVVVPHFAPAGSSAFESRYDVAVARRPRPLATSPPAASARAAPARRAARAARRAAGARR